MNIRTERRCKASFTRAVLLSSLVALCPAGVASSTRGDEPDAPANPPVAAAPKVIATVLGKNITERDLRPPRFVMELWTKESGEESAAQQARAMRGLQLQQKVIAALSQRYVTENHIEATEAEIIACDRALNKDGNKQILAMLAQQVTDLREKLSSSTKPSLQHDSLTEQLKQAEAMLKDEQSRANYEDWPREKDRAPMAEQAARVREELKSNDLTEEGRAELEKELTEFERFMNLTDEQAAAEWRKVRAETDRAMSEGQVLNWKFYRSLFKRYGGRIIWQQAGNEPVGAMQQWLEACERAGDFAILDGELKKEFWDYFTKEHPFTTEVPKGDEFDQPWWVKEPEQKPETKPPVPQK